MQTSLCQNGITSANVIHICASYHFTSSIVTYAQWRLGFIWVHKFYSHLKTQMVNQISAKDPMDISFRTIQGPSWPREECHCCQVMAVIRAVH